MSDAMESVNEDAVEFDGLSAPTSRRRLFQMGAIGAAALAGGAVLDALTATQAGAATGGDMIIGDPNTATSETSITTTSGDGIYAVTSSTGGYAGLQGFDDSTGGGYGVYGSSVNGIGIYGLRGELPSGVSSLKAGIFGDSTEADGIIGTSSSNNGVKGITSEAAQAGVAGVDTSTGGGFGVFGQSNVGIGVVGYHGTAYGEATASPVSSQGTGVLGHVPATAVGSSGPTGETYGVIGVGSIGVYGGTNGATSTAGPGVLGVGAGVGSTGLQGENSGAGPQLILKPLSSASAPSKGIAAGSFAVVDGGQLYYSFGGGSYVPMNTPVLLSAPIRILDTRAGATDAVTEPGSPISAGGTYECQVTGKVQNSISVPAGAKAVIGNITAVNAAGKGFLTLYPNGVTKPSTSSLNYPATDSLANGVTVALSSAGVMDIYSLQKTDVIFDATGYIF